MVLAILLSLAAGFCTATASVCQRLGARSLDAREPGVTGFDPMLVFRLTRCRGVRRREWLAAVAMSVGLSVFLRVASPSGGQPHASALSWWISGLVILTVVAAAVAVAVAHDHSPPRRAALLGVATGVAWGFVAAVIKEFTSHLDGGPAAVFANWAVYVLVVAGAAGMLLASHAMTAGPLAASQPGFTLLDPIVAILLGVCMFGERLQTTPADLAGEVLGLLVLAVGVAALSHSDLISSHPAAGASGTPRRDRSPMELMRKSR